MTKKKLSQLIKDKKLYWVNPSIETADWGEEKEIGTDFKLFHFDKYISSEDAVKEMEEEGYRAASIYDLLTWTDWNEKDWVVALGSVTEVNGYRSVPYLHRGGSRRYLRLSWLDGGWNARCRFLAVRNGSQALGSSETGPSVSLTLEARVKSLENDMEKIKKFLII